MSATYSLIGEHDKARENAKETIRHYPSYSIDLLRLIQFEKDNAVNDLICYCFEYAADDIKKDFIENGKSTIMERIKMEKKFGNCQCAVKNPKGK